MSVESGVVNAEDDGIENRDKDTAKCLYDAIIKHSAHPDEAIEFLNKRVRADFIREVYSLVLLQLLVTEVLVCWCKSKTGTTLMETFINRWVLLTLIWFLAYFFIVVVLICFESTMRRFPFNVFFLPTGPMLLAVLFGLVAHVFGLLEVALAIALMFVTILIFIIGTFQTKLDFTGWWALLLVLLTTSVLFLMVVFVPFVDKGYFAITTLTALLLCLYMVYDTQVMFRGQHELTISPKHYIIASHLIYSDFLYTLIVQYIFRYRPMRNRLTYFS